MGKKTVLTKTQEREVIDFYLVGNNFSAIKVKFRLCFYTAKKILESNGIEIRASREFTEEQIQLVPERYLSGESLNQLSIQFGMSITKVFRLLKIQGVKVRPKVFISESDELSIVNAYLSGISVESLAQAYQASVRPIGKILRESGIERRGRYMPIVEYKVKITNLYLSGLSCTEIADQIGFSYYCVWALLKKENVPLRNKGQVTRMYWKKDEYRQKVMSNKPDITGERSHLWKGGKTALSTIIRESGNYDRWRKAVFVRDSFICQDCGKRGSIEADHIYPFSALLHDHNIKTREQAMECEALWAIDNGRTLCKSCHKKTDTHGSGAKKYIRA